MLNNMKEPNLSSYLCKTVFFKTKSIDKEPLLG